MTYIKTNLPGFVKDEKTGFITNLNSNEKKLYENGIKTIKQTDEIKNELEELKELVKVLLGKNQ